jgi:hypothetical protein
MKERYTKRSNNDPFKMYLEASTDGGVMWKTVGISTVTPTSFDLDTNEFVKCSCTFELFFAMFESFSNLGFEFVGFVR